MILNSLVRYYDILKNETDDMGRPKLPPFGYEKRAVYHAVELFADGEIAGVIPLFQQENGKPVAPHLPVPLRVIRTNAVEPNFLVDTIEYTLGLAAEGKNTPQNKLAEKFASFRQFNRQLLLQIETPPARALLNFLERFSQEDIACHPKIQEYQHFSFDSNVAFLHNGQFIQDDPVLQQAWADYYMSNGKPGICLITGQKAALESKHPVIQGVRGTKSGGVPLISFNIESAEFMGKKQGDNAPISKCAAYKYSQAMNYLLSRESHAPKINFGDIDIIYWAECQDETYQQSFLHLFATEQPPRSFTPMRNERVEKIIREVFHNARRGPIETATVLDGLDATTRFYIVGLTGFDGRIAIRFQHQNEFGEIINRLKQYYHDAMIETSPGQYYAPSPSYLAWFFFGKKVSQDEKNIFSRDFIYSIMRGQPYPRSLFLRILDEILNGTSSDGPKAKTKPKKTGDAPTNLPKRRVTPIHAAYIKAYLMAQYRDTGNYKEALTMTLNLQCHLTPYLSGRLFAVFEKIQAEYHHRKRQKLSRSIGEEMYSAFSRNPQTHLPYLLDELASWLGGLEEARSLYFKKLIDSVFEMMTEPLPPYFDTEAQALFALGYYHQRNALYRKSPERTEQEVSDDKAIETSGSTDEFESNCD